MAGRSVGSISVTVDADTGKLKAQLARGGQAAGEAAADAIDKELANIGGAGLKKGIAKIRAQVEKGLSDIEIEIGLVLRKGALAAIREEIERGLSGIEAEISLTVNEARKAAVVEEINTAVSDIEAEVIPTVSAARKAAVVAEINAAVSGIEAEIDPTISPRAAAALRAQMAAAGSGGGAAFSKAGSDAGDSFLDAFSNRMKLIAGAVVLLAEPAGVALQGALGATVAVASSAFSALGGAAGALVPVLATVGASVATLVIGFDGLGDALGAVSEEFAAAAVEGRAFNINAAGIKETMAGLAPAAQSFVQTFAGILPMFEEIQQSVQGRLFAGLDAELANLAGKLPALGAGLGTMADSFNQFFKGLGDTIAQVDLAQIFRALQPILQSVLDAFGALAAAVEPFLLAAAPAAQELARSFEAGAKSLANMIQAGKDSGNLTKFLNEGVDSLKLWGNLLKATGDALFTLFQAGKASGDSFVASLTNIIERFDSWMESVEGQESLAKFFEGSAQIMSALVPVLEGLQGLFENLVTEGAISRFEDLADAVGRILPVIGQLLEIIGRAQILNTFVELIARVGEAIQPAIPALQKLADIIGDFLGEALDALAPVLEAFGENLAQIAEIVAPIAQALGKVLVAAFKALLPLITLTTDIFTAFTDILTENPEIIDAIVSSLEFLADVFKGLEGPIETAVGIVGFFIEAVEALAGPVVFIIEKIEDLIGLWNDLPGPVKFLISPLGFLADKFSDDAKASDEATRAATRFAGAGTVVSDMLGGVTTLIDSAVNPTTRLNDAFAIAEERGIAVGAAWTAMQGRSDELRNAIASAGNVMAVLNAEIGEGVPGSDRLVSAWAEIGGTAQEGTVLLANAASTAVTNLIDIADAANEAAEAGERLSEIWDLLFGRTQNVQEASDEFQSSLNDIRDRLTEVAESGGELSTSLEGTSQSAIDNRNLFRDARDNIVEFGTSMLEAGHSAAETEGFLQSARDQLIETAEGFDTGALSAEEYINTLGLTPEAITTIVNTPGLLEAIESGEGLEEILSLLPPEVVTAMQLTGLIPNSIALDNYQVKLDEKGKPVITVVSTEGVPFATAQVDAYGQVITGDIPNEVITEANFNDIVAESTAFSYADGLHRAIPEEITTTPTVDAAFGMGAAERYGTDLRDVVPITMGTDATYNDLIALSTATAFAGHLEDVVPAETTTTAVAETATATTDFGIYSESIRGIEGTVTTTADAQTGAASTAVSIYDSSIRGIERNVETVFSVKIPSLAKSEDPSDRFAAAAAEFGDLDLDRSVVFTAELNTDALTTFDVNTIIPNPNIEFTVIGTGLTEAITDTGTLATGISGLNTSSTFSVIGSGLSEATTDTEALVESVGVLDGTTASPEITLPDAARVTSETEALNTGLEEYGAIVAEPKINLPDEARVTSETENLTTGLEDLGDIAAKPSVVLTNYGVVVAQIVVLQLALANLSAVRATPSVTLEGYSTVVSRLATIATMLAGLRDRTITVTTNNVVTGPRTMTGRIVSSPQVISVGERSYREAIIPLDLPLNRVDPSVRAMAAMLRGEGGTRTVAGASKVVNVNQYIQPREADPEAVATKIINRAAALALR